MNSRIRSISEGLLISLVVIGILFAILEVALRSINYGDPSERRDPFYGFEGTNRLFVQKDIPEKGTYFVASPNKSQMIGAQQFPVEKSEQTYRIFTFGGSTTEGIPWDRKGSFSSWMEQDLALQFPAVNFEIINLGISGYGSARVLEIVKETVEYSPDLFIVYTGQNETRDGHFHRKELIRSRLHVAFLKLLFSSRAAYFVHESVLVLKAKIFGPRLISWASSGIERFATRPFTTDLFDSFDYYRMPTLVDSDTKGCATVVVNFEGGILHKAKNSAKNLLGCERWNRLKDWFGPALGLDDEAIYSIFQNNITSMIEHSQKYDVPIIFLIKARNPKYISALNNESVPRSYLRDGTENRWIQHYGSGLKNVQRGRCKEALQDFEVVQQQYQPLFVDSDWLLNLYAGECYERLGLYDDARTRFSRRHEEHDLALNQILQNTASAYGVPTLDVQLLLKQHANNGIVGFENYFVDAVHMTLAGYQLIGLALTRFLVEHGYPSNHGRRDGLSHVSRAINAEMTAEPPKRFQIAQTFTSLAWMSLHRGKVQEAIEKARRVVDLDPGALQAHLLLAYAYTKMGQYEDARIAWAVLKEAWRN